MYDLHTVFDQLSRIDNFIKAATAQQNNQYDPNRQLQYKMAVRPGPNVQVDPKMLEAFAKARGYNNVDEYKKGEQAWYNSVRHNNPAGLHDRRPGSNFSYIADPALPNIAFDKYGNPAPRNASEEEAYKNWVSSIQNRVQDFNEYRSNPTSNAYMPASGVRRGYKDTNDYNYYEGDWMDSVQKYLPKHLKHPQESQSFGKDIYAAQFGMPGARPTGYSSANRPVQSPITKIPGKQPKQPQTFTTK